MSPESGPRAGQYAEAIDRMAAFVRAAGVIRPLAGRREEFLSLLEALAGQHRNLEGALVTVILGGTGVGKSTLINALAGQAVAEVSALRPCTTTTTFYSHRDNDLGPLGDAVSPDDRVVANDVEGLRRKILVDPPDFDSMLVENRRKLLRVLRAADLVLCTVDPEKYRNLSLYRLLGRFRKGRSFLFVMNKADLGVDPSVVDDFRAALEDAGLPGPRLFLLSAEKAFEAARGRAAEEEAGDFPALRRVLEQEIDRAAIQRIKSANLDALLRHAYASLKLALPPDLEEGLARLPAWAEGRLDDIAARTAREAGRALFEKEERLRSFLLSAGSLSIGGLFGLYLAVAEKIGSLLAPRLAGSKAQDPVELRAAVRRAMAQADTGRVQRLLDAYQDGLAERLGSLGLSPDGKGEDEPRLLPPPPPPGRDLLAELTDEVENRLAAFVEASASGFGRNVAYNVLPLAYVLYFAWVAVVRLGRGELLDVSFFLSFVVLFAIVCFLQHVVAERGFRARGSRFMRDAEAALAARARSRLVEAAVPPLRRAAASLAEELRRFRAIGRLL